MRLRVFTKSEWEEPPRIRHQFARLMKKYGNEVIFYQKPRYFFRSSMVLNDESIQLERSAQLIHHQLRLGVVLSFLNSLYEKYSIKKTVGNYFSNDLIVNFNYDYYFLRDIFPDNIIITVINDDFVAQARFFDGYYAERLLEKTCLMSDDVLCVSKPLCEQARKWSSAKLFLPWTEKKYEPPKATTRRSVLFWAHINRRVEFSFIEFCAHRLPDVDFHLIGPVDDSVKSELNHLVGTFTNISYISSMSLDEINFDNYFSAIIPYKAGKKEIEAVTASNKTFQLLGKGMPLVVSGMPNFINSQAIVKVQNKEEFVSALLFCQREFDGLQPTIRELVSENGFNERYMQLLDIVESLKSDSGKSLV
tara:strand:- start:3861 stop:4949 length:1089 start_codon:yes stop_codon:yes gene_type:complete